MFLICLYSLDDIDVICRKKTQQIIILNLAIGSNGGDPTNTSFPSRYEVDYVRVYQLR
jgi:hypothetical protein